MNVFAWIVIALIVCWFLWVFVIPPIAARITTSKWLARITMGDTNGEQK